VSARGAAGSQCTAKWGNHAGAALLPTRSHEPWPENASRSGCCCDMHEILPRLKSWRLRRFLYRLVVGHRKFPEGMATRRRRPVHHTVWHPGCPLLHLWQRCPTELDPDWPCFTVLHSSGPFPTCKFGFKLVSSGHDFEERYFGFLNFHVFLWLSLFSILLTTRIFTHLSL